MVPEHWTEFQLAIILPRIFSSNWMSAVNFMLQQEARDVLHGLQPIPVNMHNRSAVLSVAICTNYTTALKWFNYNCRMQALRPIQPYSLHNYYLVYRSRQWRHKSHNYAIATKQSILLHCRYILPSDANRNRARSCRLKFCLSVCLSVCPCVSRMHCNKTKQKENNFCSYFDTI